MSKRKILEHDEIEREQTDNDSDDLDETDSVKSISASIVVASHDSSIGREEKPFRVSGRMRTSPREPEFTIGELCILTRYLDKYYNTLFGLDGEGGRNVDGMKSKEELLRRMAKKCTDLGEAIRTPEQCAQKLRIIMNNVRRYANALKNELMKPCGGNVDNICADLATIRLYEVLERNPRASYYIHGTEVYDQINDAHSSSSSSEPPAKRLASGKSASSLPIRYDESYEFARISALEADRKRAEAQEKAAEAETNLFVTQTAYWRMKIDELRDRRENEGSREHRNIDPRARRHC